MKSRCTESPCACPALTCSPSNCLLYLVAPLRRRFSPNSLIPFGMASDLDCGVRLRRGRAETMPRFIVVTFGYAECFRTNQVRIQNMCKTCQERDSAGPMGAQKRFPTPRYCPR